ncbi:hypothetical protein ACXR8U_01365 [Methylobacterium radiotolerans]
MSRYRRLPGAEPRYVLAAARTLIAERAYRLSLYAVDVAASDGQTGRHVLAVPVAIGAVDPPPMKWSALWYGFEPGGRIDVEEATQA